jgi:hypothetical protein
MLLNPISVVSLFLQSIRGNVTWTATPFNPNSMPLAVRTPYLSTWLPQSPEIALNDAWPTFWNGQVFRLRKFRYCCERFRSIGLDSWLGRIHYSWRQGLQFHGHAYRSRSKSHEGYSKELSGIFIHLPNRFWVEGYRSVHFYPKRVRFVRRTHRSDSHLLEPRRSMLTCPHEKPGYLIKPEP